ncbi:DUF2190 family protein [Roseomonas mucosa]|uniref:DUF2190 family protein n=1 Tax=Roseomonas mucosa TaxID=207340 RepID=UPI00384AAA85
MAKNFIHDGRRLVCQAPAGGVLSGAFTVIASLFGVALTTAAAGSNFTLHLGGVWTLPKATGAIAQGAPVYWDATAKVITGTAGSNLKVGVAETAAASADTVMAVRLNAVF